MTEYIGRDPQDEGALKAIVPLGFTGQGSMWFSSVAPAGWLICDGSLIDKDKYPDLWLLLGDTWGTSTADQFYIPNMADRAPVGVGTNALAAGFGSTEHAHESGSITSSINLFTNAGTLYIDADVTSASYTEDSRYQTTGGVTSSGGRSEAATQGIASTGSTANASSYAPSRAINFIIKT